MRIDRLVVAGIALVVTAALTLFAVLGSSGPRQGPQASFPDPAASGRGAQLLNPHCRHVPAPDFEHAPNRPLVGAFEDPPYGYAVTIPPGLRAYTRADNPAPGFGIVLSWQPRVFVQVHAAYDQFYDITAAAVHRRDVQGIRLHDRLLEEKSTPDQLGGEPAERDQMRFQCPGDAQVYLLEDLIVLRHREVYRLELQTVPERLAQDLPLLDRMQRSWRWLQGPKSF